MNLVGIVGYKDSGKTTLARALAQELTMRGHRVAVIKHTSHHIDLAGKDTAMLLEASSQVAILSAQASAVFWREPMGLEGILAHLDADLVLIEGLKAQQGYSKIACLRGLPDDRDLIDDLSIAAIGPTDQVGDLDIPVFDRDDVDSIADLVERVHFAGTESATA